MADDSLAWLDAFDPTINRVDLAVLEATAPQLLLRGPDGEVWGVDDQRVILAVASAARSLHAELDVERRRSDQLGRRTRWLYEHVTGQQLPAEGDA